MARKPGSALASEIGPLLAQARRETFWAAARRLETVGESMYVWQALNTLRRLGGSATQRELATASAQHPAGISRLLEELEEAGHVRRERSSEDRRKMVVALTAKGRTKLAAMQRHVEEGLAEVFAVLASSELRELRDLLLKLVRK